MGFQKLIGFTVLLLIWKICRVHAQATCVEYINQPCTSQAVATTVQSLPQIIIPALVKPVSSYDSYIQNTAPIVPSFCGCNDFNGYSSGYPGFLPSYPGLMPPIIVEDDDGDNLNSLLYFLIFAMKNRRNNGNCGCNCGCNNNCGCGGGCNCGCGGCNCGCGGCNCGCGGCNCGCSGYNGGYNCGYNGYNYNGNYGGGSYFPYPFPYSLNNPYSCGYPNFGGYNDNCCPCEDDYSPNSNVIKILISGDSCSTC